MWTLFIKDITHGSEVKSSSPVVGGSQLNTFKDGPSLVHQMSLAGRGQDPVSLERENGISSTGYISASPPPSRTGGLTERQARKHYLPVISLTVGEHTVFH